VRRHALRAGVLLAAALLPSPLAAQPLTPLAAAVHLHSDLSTGQYTLEELAEMAERQGLGALLISENYLNRVDYGLPPFRALTRVSQDSPSVRWRLAEFRERLSRARAARPGVLIVPGVEIMPHYRWSGSPLALELSIADTQKNVLAFGITDPAVLAAIPAIGNHAAGAYSIQSLLDALPIVLVIPGVLLFFVKRRRRVPVGAAVMIVRQRLWIPAMILCAIAVAAFVRGWPFTTTPYSAYADYGAEPYQAVIDYVEGNGGVAMWSFPEARDSGTQNVGPVRVSWSTEPYADDLLRTFRYTAFGALYEETTRVERPGAGWDRLLAQYAAGERSRPAWGVGESGYHDSTGEKQLGRVQTVFWVRERTEAGVLEALRAGRLYARLRTPKTTLALAEFAAQAEGAAAIGGETLRPVAGATLTVSVAVEAAGVAVTDLKVVLIKDGAIAEAWTGATPFRGTHREAWDGRPAVFRLEARGAGGRLLSSPIFVRRA
jgi:hypothetical protein